MIRKQTFKERCNEMVGHEIKLHEMTTNEYSALQDRYLLLMDIGMVNEASIVSEQLKQLDSAITLLTISRRKRYINPSRVLFTIID